MQLHYLFMAVILLSGCSSGKKLPEGDTITLEEFIRTNKGDVCHSITAMCKLTDNYDAAFKGMRDTHYCIEM